MSSRGNFLGTGPASGVYTPKPTPQLPEDMPIYINDELLDLGGRLNNILEGGAFPPQSQLPKRVKDGMMIYFTLPIPDSQISSAGVWLYRKEKWWKIIDDPSAISQNLTVYKKFPKGSTRPPKPPINKYLVDELNGWDYVPESNDDANDQWMSVAVWAVTDPDNPIVDWAEPIMFNTEGTAGQPGSDGYSIEFRYIASTLKPSIKNKLDKAPVTNEGKAYVTSIPSVTHPNENYVWQIQTYIRNDELGQAWSDPVRFSTPDTTKANTCYATARDGYPTFDPKASGLPGTGWAYTIPATIPEGHNLWRSDRLEWTDGTAQSPWTTPYKANGQVGSKQETRYTASTNKPVIANASARNPVGTAGEVFSLAMPPASHPNKNFIWATTGIVNRLNEMEMVWSEPAKYATPDSTSSVKAYAKGTLTTFPTFTPSSAGLPGSGWSKEFPGGLVKDEYIWETSRLEWTDGTSQTNWTTPVRTMGYDGIDGTTVEYRYRASTSSPNIATGDREPVGWNLNVPQVSHPNESYVWVSSAVIRSNNTLARSWAVPAKYATPDSLTYKYAYGVGTDTSYPTFNPNSAGLPGSGWAYEPQKVNRGQRVWVTARYQWNDSTGATVWITPSLFSGSDGPDGSNGNDGMTLVMVYKNSSSKPAEIPDAERNYPPAGWSKDQENPPMGQATWISKNYVRGRAEEATTTMYNYSGVAQLSGYPGQNGNPGTNGSNGTNGITYYTWIMYANSDTGTDISASPVNKKYVGFAYNQKVSTPSMNGFDYAWYKLEGTQGIPGQNGADGVTLYTWLKYADNADGTVGMSDSPLGKTYMGLAYNKLDQNESTDPKLYQWSLIKGADGTNGQPGAPGSPGAPGINGNDGLPGSPGAGFYRLSMTNFNNVWPSQPTVDSAFRSEFGRDSEQDDVLTIFNPADVKIAQTRRKASTGAWVEAELLVHGDMILRGTIVADRIAAGAISTDKLAAGAITADKISANAITSDKIQANVSINAPVITGGQLNGAHLNIGNGTFTVNGSSGHMVARSAEITGAINATSGSFNGTVTGGVIQAGTRIELGSNFSVDANGVMTCNNAVISGKITAYDGSFNGTVNIKGNSIIEGTLSGGNVTGTTLSGGSIHIPAIGNTRFYVDGSGNMTCNNATINGSFINNGDLTGTSIYVPNKSDPKFSVASDGTTTIQSSSTGSRMVIKNDRIEVWEGSVLRVILGRL